MLRNKGTLFFYVKNKINFLVTFFQLITKKPPLYFWEKNEAYVRNGQIKRDNTLLGEVHFSLRLAKHSVSFMV